MSLKSLFSSLKKKEVEPKLHIFFCKGGGYEGMITKTGYDYLEEERDAKRIFVEDIQKNFQKEIKPRDVTIAHKLIMSIGDAFGKYIEVEEEEKETKDKAALIQEIIGGGM